MTALLIVLGIVLWCIGCLFVVAICQAGKDE